MKKLILIMSIFILTTLSFTSTFVEKSFKAHVKEISKINNTNRVKEYDIEYTPGKLIIKVLSPEVNKGEIYTYTKENKTVYYPKLKKTEVEELDEEESNLFNIIEELRGNSNKGYTKYVRKGDKVYKVINRDYKIILENYNGEYPKVIKYVPYGYGFVEYLLDYKN